MEDVIENWSVQDCVGVSIDLIEIDEPDATGGKFYNAIVTYHLEESEDDETTKAVTIITSAFDDCKYKLSYNVMTALSMLHDVYSLVSVFDESGESVDSFDFSEVESRFEVKSAANKLH